jgi:hypothetical protein
VHDPNKKRYIFQADAIGVSGQVTDPFHDTIPVQAASALSPSGGYGSARADGFRYKEILSIGAAYTEVIGSETHHEGHVFFETLALSVVEKFNLLDVVTCDRIVARLTSVYPGVTPNGRLENYVTPVGSRLENLRIGNEVLGDVELAPKLIWEEQRACWTGLWEAIQQERDLFQSLSLRNPKSNYEDLVPLPARQEESSVLGFCIALRKEKEAEAHKPVKPFVVPQFGTVHLGEFFCYPHARRLITLRVELGCPGSGPINGPTAMINGGPYPPPG